MLRGLCFVVSFALASAWAPSSPLQSISRQTYGRGSICNRNLRLRTPVSMQQARNAAEALKLLEEKDRQKARAAFDDRFKSFTVKLSKPMGLVFEENDTAAKGIFLKSIDRTKSNPKNTASLSELSIGDNLISVNGQNCLGLDFDTAFGYIVDAPEEVELKFAAGGVLAVVNPRGFFAITVHDGSISLPFSVINYLVKWVL